ncbi:uncharacterized protein [Choristoneura fumiferana]|uniref:uncharacterized protein n=1 Tax=Choristoneura fumiferana TaxID=7141 RepID=UPI003D156B64
MEEDLKKLVAKRGYLKASLTRIFNAVDRADQEPLSPALAQTKIGRLRELFLSYQDINIEILCLNSADTENVGESEDKYAACLTKLSVISANTDASSRPVRHSQVSNIKLPSIDIDTFTGQYRDYTRFINIFTSMIHNNTTLDDVQRLYYLRNFVSGEPLDLIKNLPIFGESYTEALSILKDRYDNRNLIMSDHISQLLELAPSKPTAASLREFSAHVKQQVKALTCIHESVSHWDIILVHLLVKKLDPTTANAFQLNRDCKIEPTINEFVQFIEKRALALESVDQGTSKQCDNVVVNAAYQRDTERQMSMRQCIHSAPAATASSGQAVVGAT